MCPFVMLSIHVAQQAVSSIPNTPPFFFFFFVNFIVPKS